HPAAQRSAARLVRQQGEEAREGRREPRRDGKRDEDGHREREVDRPYRLGAEPAQSDGVEDQAREPVRREDRSDGGEPREGLRGLPRAGRGRARGRRASGRAVRGRGHQAFRAERTVLGLRGADGAPPAAPPPAGSAAAEDTSTDSTTPASPKTT